MYAMFAIVSSSLLKENLPSHIVTQMAYMVNKVLARAKKKKREMRTVKMYGKAFGE